MFNLFDSASAEQEIAGGNQGAAIYHRNRQLTLIFLCC